MKRIYYLILLMATIGFASCSSSQNFSRGYYDDYDHYDNGYSQNITYERFYNELSPYGRWINYPGQGSVWIPYESNFQPYQTNGRWVYTNYGWTWASDYNWGWAPFHYGRWRHDYRYGWMWVPGYEWGPAWVAWRGGGGYYGWAPLGPGMNINISIGSIPYNDWYFVPSRYITSSQMDRYYVRPSRNVTIINNTTIINNYYQGRDNHGYVAGPRVNEVERQTKTKIAPVRVINTSAPGRTEVEKDQVGIYRPDVQPTNVNRSGDLKNVPVRRLEPQTGSPKVNSDGINDPGNLRKPTNTRTFPGSAPEQKTENSTDRNPFNTPVQQVEKDRKLTPVNDRIFNESQRENRRFNRMEPQPERRVIPKMPERKEQEMEQPLRQQPVRQQPVRQMPVRQQPVRELPQRKVEPSPRVSNPGTSEAPQKESPVHSQKPLIRKF